jgi:hypothetical protein
VRTPSPALDSTGVTYQAGTTWYDYQHNGTAGKMLAVDDLGFVHVTWMNGLNSPSTSRHVYYNVWDPSTQTYTSVGGQQVNSQPRGGYACITVAHDGFSYPTFHVELTPGGTAFAASAIDFLPATGAFTTVLIDTLDPPDNEIIWPKVDMDIDGKLHVVSTENPASGAAGDPQRIFYSRGTPVIEGGFGIDILWDDVDNGSAFMYIDTVMVIAPDVACSRHSNRVVVAWSDSRDTLTTQHNNDIYYMVSEDGGVNWGEPVNVTNFIAPDWDCASQDTVVCDRDTFRVYTDLSLLLDEQDNIHIAFTTKMYYSLEGLISVYASQIWHWGSNYGYYSPIRAVSSDYINANWAADLGDWQLILQRPNLSIDPTNGDLYVSYQFHDTISWSEGGIPVADAWVAKSVDSGVSWSEGINVTETGIGDTMVAAGECQHERDITLAETVTYSDGTGYLHMSYVFDLDAGGAVGTNPTGIPTLNPVYYQRIPVNDIPATPLWDNQHPVLHVDSSGIPQPVSVGGGGAQLPESFTLYQNYPNPFNPATKIQFDLASAATVKLSVFDILGREVSTLVNNETLSGGTHVVEFDAGNMPSGIYMYRLEAGGLSESRKMILMK